MNTITSYVDSSGYAQARAQQQANMMYGNNIFLGNTTATGTNDIMFSPDPSVKEPSEFKKLTNHRFHELLDRFQMICMLLYWTRHRQ